MSPKRAEKDLLAEVNGARLYTQDIGSSLVKAKNQKDSLFIMNKLVDDWVMEQIQYQEAKRKIDDQSQINTLTQNYERSLFIDAYERKLLEEELDTIVDQTQIDSFYNEHREEFILQETIARCILIKIPINIDNDSIQELWKTEDIPALSALAKSEDFFNLLDLDRWYYRYNLKNVMPDNLYKKLRFNKANNYSLETDEYKYYVKILQIFKAEETAPVSFVKERIKHRILQDRIKSVLKTTKTRLYNEKIKSKAIKIYTKSSE